MTADLDRLELELRFLPGVLSVGFERAAADDALLVQVVVVADRAAGDLRGRVRRITSTCGEPVQLELVVESQGGAPAHASGPSSAPSPQTPPLPPPLRSI